MRVTLRSVRTRFRHDTRAIEGLPIRLVIALVVGAASLSIMLNMLSGVGSLAVTELDARPQPAVTTSGEQTITVSVVDTDGTPVTDATVVVTDGSADLPGIEHARTGPDGNATLTIAPSLRPNQAQGTLEIDIKPPAGSGYADRRANTEILVIEE